MINLEILNNADRWHEHCEQQQTLNPVPKVQQMWRGRLDIDQDSLDLHTESHYTDRHGTGTLADHEIKPEAAVLDRCTIGADHPAYQQILRVCGLSLCRVSVNLQQPGCFIPAHWDRNRTFVKTLLDQNANVDWSNIRRFFYFFEDQAPGQFVQLGNTQLRWRAGDMIEWPYYLRHATANASYSARTMLSIVGI